MNNAEILSVYGLNRATAVSLFIPDTYEVYWNLSPTDLLDRMKKEHNIFWNEERTLKLNALGLSQAEVSTLASIVEEETSKKDEKPVVAGLYLNRLKRGIPLQADPTVKFALQNFGLRRIYKKHLEYDSPYNTYLYAGLPPGPIRIPSKESIDAVLNFTKHNYIYMCAKEDFSGYHNFASSLDEHNKNAAKYRNALNKKNIR
ncbi:MAG: endolytic transglycosylase MltG, partial [Paludibacteraceae bacterium]|nr:endolytic transglycosylase MltG [Paludibacteraceae bacterium]